MFRCLQASLLARPLEAVAGAAGALFQQRAIGQGAAHNVHTLATMPGNNVEVAAGGDPLELLVGAGAASPLDHLRTVGSGSAVYVQAFATVAADDIEVTAAFIDELPLLPGIPIPGILADFCAVRRIGLLHIHHLAAVAVGNAVVGRSACTRIAGRQGQRRAQ